MKRTYYTIMLAGALSFGLSAACTASGIHKLVDERGRVIFTNDPAKNTRQIQSSKSVSVVPSRRNGTSTEPITVAITGSNYPRVSKLQQDQRDSKRRQILAQELANETRLLEDALKTIDLTQQKTDNYLPGRPYFTSDHFDILQLRNQAAAHERNIEALKMELNNL
ncbi:MAG: DUF4124 domain-containing protein [Nitrosomonas sp.]|nr:DUF4124 domain-containing protein [Nitrosomonas sp.]MDL1864944.1 DUF4124 domain-containing protein [Betaproteobacteria bacterium PRO5]